jgi:hypothetical protein
MGGIVREHKLPVVKLVISYSREVRDLGLTDLTISALKEIGFFNSMSGNFYSAWIVRFKPLMH